MSAVWAKVKPQVKSKPFAGHIGAELSGVTGSGQLSKAVSDQIYQALLQYKMLFFSKKTEFDRCRTRKNCCFI